MLWLLSALSEPVRVVLTATIHLDVRARLMPCADESWFDFAGRVGRGQVDARPRSSNRTRRRSSLLS